MLRIIQISAIIIAASLHTVALAQDLRLEEGTAEDLRGVTKVYVAAEFEQHWIVHFIVDSIRKELPELTFVTFSDDADVLLLISEEKRVESDPESTASPYAVPRERVQTSYKLLGRIICLQVPGHARLVKKISTNWQDFSGVANRSPQTLAREFVEAYRTANSSGQPRTSRVPPTATAPPGLTGGRTQSDPEVQASSSPTIAGPEEIGEEDVVRINTSLVTVHTNVISRDGRPAPTLRKEDFSIYEDGIKQDLAVFEPVNTPFSVVLLIDVSGSVKPRLNAIVEAANTLVNSLKADDQVAILTFASVAKEVLKLSKVRDLRNNKLSLLPGGSTRLYDAVDLVISKYVRRLPGRKAVVMLTDGLDSSLINSYYIGSFIADAAKNLRDAEELDALFYAVQYNTWIELVDNVPNGMKVEDLRKLMEERSTEYLQGLAYKTGGRVYRADGISDLAPAFAAVVEELSRQYSLGYYPRRAARGGERRLIKVRVNSPDLVVRARDSYLSTLSTSKPAAAK